MSIVHIPNKTLFLSKKEKWLESRFHFSFSEYYDSSNVEFGVLRVLNDDIVKPGSGFGTHQHQDMEIVTYVIDGEITHVDSMGKAETLGRGCVQYLSAGTGVTHSEMNNGDKKLRFLQIWIKPDVMGLEPNYGSRTFRHEDRQNRLLHIVSSFTEVGVDSRRGVIPINQDVNMFVCELDNKKSIDFVVDKKRQLYMVCIEGTISVESQSSLTTLNSRDGLKAIPNKGKPIYLKFFTPEGKSSHFLAIEMVKK